MPPTSSPCRPLALSSRLLCPVSRSPRLPFALCLVAVAVALAGCSSLNFGVHIPGTPLSVGTSVPLKKSPAAKNYKYVKLPVESTPPGAAIYTNGELVGSTPMDVLVPFEKGFWGGAKGSCQITLRKGGLAPAGARVFAVGGGISRDEGGEPMEKLEMRLMKE